MVGVMELVSCRSIFAGLRGRGANRGEEADEGPAPETLVWP